MKDKYNKDEGFYIKAGWYAEEEQKQIEIKRGAGVMVDLLNQEQEDLKKAMIEEMAKDIAKRDCHLFDNCPKEHKHNCISQEPEIMLESSKNYITIATWLVNAGYQKLPEDSVVLSTEEYEEVVKCLNEYADKLNNFPNEVNALMDMYKKGSEETAEKIFNQIIWYAVKRIGQTSNDSYYQISFDRLNELAKQFGVEIKE